MKGLLLAGMMAASVVAQAGDFENIIGEAQAINKQAAQAHFEWRDTTAFIDEAKWLQSKGRVAEAMKLAKFAKKQAALSLQQSVDQADAGPVKSTSIQPY